MTQIINDKLKKICENCREKCDKSCAWISLGNEYCDDIMELQKEIERLNKEKSILEKALRLVLQYDIGVINYDELDKANKMVEKYNKELKEGK